MTDLRDAATSLFDAAFAADWGTAGEWVRVMSDSAAALPADLPKPDLVAQLRSRIQDARNGASAHERVGTMDAANGVSHLVADLSAEYQTNVPYEVLMLGYFGRQLELGIAADQPSTLTQATTDLRSAWNRVAPSIERRGHTEDAKRFTDIVVRLEGARRPADFVAPTRAELAAAERIETLYRSPTS